MKEFVAEAMMWETLRCGRPSRLPISVWDAGTTPRPWRHPAVPKTEPLVIAGCIEIDPASLLFRMAHSTGSVIRKSKLLKKPL